MPKFDHKSAEKDLIAKVIVKKDRKTAAIEAFTSMNPMLQKTYPYGKELDQKIEQTIFLEQSQKIQ